MNTISSVEQVPAQSDALAGEVSNDWNGATVIGVIPQDILDRRISYSVGSKAKAQSWGRRTDVPMSDFLDAMTFHQEGKKDGQAITQGSLVGTERRSAQVKENFLCLLDFDNGTRASDVIEALQRHGLFAVVVSTHSHSRATTEINRDALSDYVGKNVDAITLEDAVRWLREERGFLPHVLEGAMLLPDVIHGASGVEVAVRHQPIDKFRVCMVLERPFVFANRGGKHKEAIAEWSDRYRGVAKMLGNFISDSACVDPSRMMYTPRHIPGAPYFVTIVGGKALDLDNVERVPAAGRRAPPTAVAGSVGATTKTAFRTPWLGRFLKKHAKGFDARDFADSILESRGGRDFECPFDDGHSNPGDPNDKGFFCENADGEKGFVMKCMHASCSGRDRAAFLDEIIQTHGLTEEELMQFVAEIVEEDDAGAGNGNALHSSTKSDGSKPPYPYAEVFGLFGQWKGTKEEPYFSEVCTAFEVLGITHDETGAGWGKIIRFKNRAGRDVEIFVSDGRIHDDATALRKEIADAGLWICPKGKNDFDDLLSRLVSDNVIVTATRPGWHSDAEGRRYYLTPLGEMIGADPDGAAWRLKDGVGIKVQGRRGTLEGWQKAAEGLIEANDHWAIAVAAGWAGVLVELCGYETCGLMLSGRSSRGKTTALEAASSSWGYVGPKLNDGLVVSARSTANAVEALAARANGTVLAIDELKLLDAREVGTLIMSLSTGSGKSRMTKDAKLKASASWASFVLLSGEKTVRQYIEGAGETYLAGYTARLPDLNVSEGKTLSPDAVKALREDGIRAHYGHAGPAFVEALFRLGYVADPATVTDRIHAAAVSIAGEDGKASEIMLRAARPFAICAIAASIAGDGGVISEDAVDRIHDALIASWERFGKSDEAQAADPLHEAQAALLDYLASNCRGGPVVRMDDEHAKSFRETIAWFDDASVYVRTNKLAEIAGGKVTQSALARYLSKHGVLVTRGLRDGELAHDYIRGVGAVRHYQLDAFALGFEPPPKVEYGNDDD